MPAESRGPIVAPPVWRRRLRAGALAIAGLVLTLEAYTLWPSSARAAELVVAPGTRELVLLVHGSFGREEPAMRELERRFRELAARTVDVTAARAAAGYRGNGHRWPIEYYRARLSAGDLPVAP